LAPDNTATLTDPSFGPATFPVGEIVDAAAAPRTFGSVDVFAFAPSGKGITGKLGVIADAAANSCLFHGHVALEG
jgi:hypothetical protein